MGRYDYAINTLGNRITSMFVLSVVFAYISIVSVSLTVLVAIDASSICNFIAVSYWSVVFTIVTYIALRKAQKDIIIVSEFNNDVDMIKGMDISKGNISSNADDKQ